jgi:hypothetical protein
VSSSPRTEPPGSRRPEPAGSPAPALRAGPLFLVIALGLLAGAVAVGALAWSTLREGSTGPSPTADVAASEDGFAVWDRDAAGHPIRWDPCSPIEVVVSVAGAPDSVTAAELRRDVEAAAADIGAVSGLDVVVTGTTDDRPHADRPTTVTGPDGPRWAPVLIGWRTPHEAGLPMRDTDRALALPISARPEARGAPATYVTGQIVLNAEREELRPGRDDRADSWGATILHELGHIVGLDHVDDADEVMAVHPGRGPVALGPGDRAGLRAVGADAGCVEVPTARELDVPVPER